MDFSSNFSLDPRKIDLRDLTAGLRAIRLTRSGGDTLTIDPDQSKLDLQQEHPPVERMEGDLGAICEVFRQSSAYYLILSGVPLTPGDRVELTYRHRPHTVTLRVVEVENGRVRIDPPVVHQAEE